MAWGRWTALALGLALSHSQPDSAEAARRVALVVGNEAYQRLEPLKNAVQDAVSYAGALTTLGFDEVILRTDRTRSEMDEDIAAFLDRIAPGDMVVFVYAGHGWSDGSQNYILGIDAPETGSKEFLTRISLPLRNGATGLIDDLDRRGAAIKVAIIDACRNNPFRSGGGDRGIGVSRGLVRNDMPVGTFLVFSAAPGQIALDRLTPEDSHPNSVFTRVFVPLLARGDSLQRVMKETQEQVALLAAGVNHQQQPSYVDEVLGDTCLAATCAESRLRPEVSEQTQSSGQNDREVLFWESIRNSSNPADFRAYLDRFPNGTFAPLARKRVADLAPASSVSNDVPEESAPFDFSSLATDFLFDYLRSWSQENSLALDDIKRLYADRVVFYGAEIPFSKLYEEKEAFAVRWPVRDYSVRPETISVECVRQDRCIITSVVSWDALAPGRNSRSRGTAELALTLEARAGRSLVIIAETGRVLSRD